MLEQAIVGLIVVVAAAYASWKLMPRNLRVRVGTALLNAARSGAGLPEQRVLRMQRRLAGSECGLCDSCGGCAGKAPALAPSGMPGDRPDVPSSPRGP